MAKVNLKSIYTSADKFTILQLLEEFVNKVDAIDFPSDEEMKQAQEDIEILQGKVETVEDTTIPGLANRLTTVEGKVDTLEITTVPALANRLTTVEGKVNTLETTTIPALDSRVTELETAVITKLYKHSITVNVGSDNYMKVEIINASNTQFTSSTFDFNLIAGKVVFWGGTGFFVLTGSYMNSHVYGYDISDTQSQEVEVNLPVGLGDTVTALN